MSKPKFLQASFFWQNDKPDGVGFSFGPPDYSPTDLAVMFEGENLARYMRDSDLALGTNIVNTYIAQLSALAQRRQANEPIEQHEAILAALNIMWLVERGFIPNDEFNGVQFVTELAL